MKRFYRGSGGIGMNCLHLLNESAVSINESFNMNSETLTCLNRIIFTYFGTLLVMADFRYFVMAAWIDFTLNSTLYIVVQLILVWGARKTYLEWCDHGDCNSSIFVLSWSYEQAWFC